MIFASVVRVRPCSTNPSTCSAFGSLLRGLSRSWWGVTVSPRGNPEGTCVSENLGFADRRILSFSGN